MSETSQLTAIIQREDDGYVARCPELDIASQGQTVEEARTVAESQHCLNCWMV